jgi:hypothetical protein
LQPGSNGPRYCTNLLRCMSAPMAIPRTSGNA